MYANRVTQAEALMSDQFKSKARRFYEEAYGKGNLAVVDEVIAPNCTLHDPAMPEMQQGTASVKQMIREYREAIPDLNFLITDEIEEGNMVATRWIARGTHTASLKGIPPTNRRFEIPGILISKFEGGKMVDAKVVWDALGLNAQLGLLPVGAGGNPGY